MNTLPEYVQERLNEYDNFVNTYYVSENKLTRVYEMTPTGEETVSYIQRKTSPPSMRFIDFVEKVFIPKTPFTKKPFILREGCTWEEMYVHMAKQDYHYTCIGEAEVIEYVNNPRKDGTVDDEVHFARQIPKRKTLREKIADEKYKRWMEALRYVEANRATDDDFNW